MDINKLKSEAIYLKQLLEKYSSIESEATACAEALEPYITKAIAGRIIDPIDVLPCGYSFHEGTLRKYRDLEEAYSNFSFRITGGDEEELNNFFKSLEDENH